MIFSLKILALSKRTEQRILYTYWKSSEVPKMQSSFKFSQTQKGKESTSKWINTGISM